MHVEYKNARVRKQCIYPDKEFRGNQNLIIGITTRMIQLESATSLLDIKRLVDANFHSLTGDRKYEIAIDAIIGGKRSKERIIFKPIDGEDIFNDMNNDNKIKTVTKIEILEISVDHYKK